MKYILPLILVLAYTTNLSSQNDTILVNKIDTAIMNTVVIAYDEGVYLKTDETADLLQVRINGEDQFLPISGGKAYLTDEISQKGKLLFFNTKDQKSLVHISQKAEGYRIKTIPLWMSVIPPLVAILLALLLKEVIVSLFLGIFAGAFIAGGLRVDSFYYMLQSLFDVVRKYLIDALYDTGHLSVIVFSLLIGGMVAIISKNGGMVGVVNALSRYAKGPRSSQAVTYLLGVVIFFDDYANTLIVGNTMRPVTDKYRVSREKLAYIVDATAAPVAAVAFITTWIGAELGYIDDGLRTLNLHGEYTPYSVFISSLKYSYYTIFTLIFMAMLIYMKKDYGPMLKAEKRARSTGQVSPAKTLKEDEPNMEDLSPVANAPMKWYHAVIPVLTVIFMTIFALLDSGLDAAHADMTGVAYNWGAIWQNISSESEGSLPFYRKLGIVIGASNSYEALLMASISGVLVAIAMTVYSKIMTLFDTMHWLVNGFKTMMPALIILSLAWSLAKTTDALHTADFMSEALTGNVSPLVLPILIFFLAAIISFSTGSSWSTMAILYPIAIPTTYAICMNAGMDIDATMEVLYSVIATVLSASVLGDHCSPISDTTILSSLASDCNHLDHVKTQMPYALTVGAVALITKGLSTLLGGSSFITWAMFGFGILSMYLIIRFVGKDVDEEIAEIK